MAEAGSHEALNAKLRSMDIILELWEPKERMVRLCVPKIILWVSVEHKARDRGPVKRLV